MAKPFRKSMIKPVDSLVSFTGSPARDNKRYVEVDLESINSIMFAAQRKKTPTNPVRRAEYEKEKEVVAKI